MENIWKMIVKGAAAVGGVIGGALGGWDALIKVLLAMMVVDYISGIIVALMGRSKKTEYGGLDSKVGWVGLAKKGMQLLVVLVATLLDGALNLGTAMCRDAACWFYVANECLSLTENLNLMGVPFPRRLKELLGDKLSEAEGDGEDKPPNGGADIDIK